MYDYYKAEEVRAQAKGQWLFILAHFAPELEPALKKAGQSHVTCPFHGGKKDFRMFKDAHDTGGAICTCGSWHDGFELLGKARSWDFLRCLTEVGQLINAPKYPWVVEVKTKGAQSVQNVQQQAVQTKTASVPQACVSSTYAATPVHSDHLSIAPKWVDGNEPRGIGTPPAVESERYGAPAFAPAAETEAQYQGDMVAETMGLPESAQPEAKVVPLFAEQSKPWLMELQEKMQQRAERNSANNARLKQKIDEVWNECLPFNSQAAEPLRAYFVSRELLFMHDVVEQTDSLRFHPEMPYYDEDGNEVGKFPTVVQAIRDAQGNLVTLHRTYLTKNGKKAKVECAKKMMPVPDGMRVTGGAVRLGIPTEGVLGLAEGLETALSGLRASHIPTWSTVNATLLENFEVPEELNVHTVVIFADKDKSLTGERTANVLKAKLEKQGYVVHVLLPKLPIPPRAKGIDWNDVLVTQGLMGFPSRASIRKLTGLSRSSEEKGIE